MTVEHVPLAPEPAAPALGTSPANASASPPSTVAPTRPSAAPSARSLILTAAHLAVLGLAGTVPVVLLIALFSLAAATIALFGIGLLFFILLVHLMIGLARFETARVQDLYGLPRTPVSLASRPTASHPGPYLRWLWRQGTSLAVCRPLASFVVGWLMGLVLLWCALAGAGLLGSALRHLVDGQIGLAPIQLVLGVLMALGALGVTRAHAALAPALVSLPSRRELARAVHATREQRASAVRSADLERTRIERDLHDGVQPRLVSVGMTLGLARHKIDSDPDSARALIVEAHSSTKTALTELRQVSRGIHASVLADRGLDAALSSLAARNPLPVELDMRLDDAVGPGGENAAPGPRYREAETAAYYLIAEALTNAAKHARATGCRVQGRIREAGTPQAGLWIRVEDDGVGGARIVPGGGLDGIAQRVHGAGGTYTLASPDGGPTSLEVSLPCA